MLVKVSWPGAFGDEAKEKFAALDWEEVQRWHPLADKDEKPNTGWDLNYYFDKPTRLTEEEIFNLQRLGFTLEVMPYPGAMVTKMAERKKWDGPVQPMDLNSGAAVQITVADMALLLINEVDWIEDACTDVLQGKLDEGWRILAVCPPNAARRPDYILGRVKQKESR